MKVKKVIDRLSDLYTFIEDTPADSFENGSDEREEYKDAIEAAIGKLGKFKELKKENTQLKEAVKEAREDDEYIL